MGTLTERVATRFIQAQGSLSDLMAPHLEGGDRYDHEYVVEHIDSAIDDMIYKGLSPKVIQGAMSKAKTSGRGSYSDGTYPRDGGLGYSFTVEFPDKAVTEGVLTLPLPDLVKAAKKGLKDNPDVRLVDDKKLWAKLKRWDFGPAVKEAVEDQEPDDFNLDATFVERLSDLASQGVEQSISAWKEGEGDVELGEYPGVYLDWDLRLKAFETGSIKVSGHQANVPLRATWELRPQRWSFDTDRDWNRIT